MMFGLDHRNVTQTTAPTTDDVSFLRKDTLLSPRDTFTAYLVLRFYHNFNSLNLSRLLSTYFLVTPLKTQEIGSFVNGCPLASRLNW
jgi:hypothetical protein